MSDLRDMNQPDLRVRELFVAALCLPNGPDRERYVAAASHGDDGLREGQ